jgi:hypothetical protein
MRRRVGVDLVGEVKAVVWCFISSSTENGRVTDGDSARRSGASRGRWWHRASKEGVDPGGLAWGKMGQKTGLASLEMKENWDGRRIGFWAENKDWMQNYFSNFSNKDLSSKVKIQIFLNQH